MVATRAADGQRRFRREKLTNRTPGPRFRVTPPCPNRMLTCSRSSISSIGKGMPFATPGGPSAGAGASSNLAVSRIEGGGGGARGGLFADPRPISARSFQAATIAAVVDYCLSTSYRAGPLSAKILASPTGKDFAAVVQHLCARLDASYLLAGRLEDEVQTVFKVLRCVRRNTCIHIDARCGSSRRRHKTQGVPRESG